MSVWLVCPSARPVEHVREWAAAWRERGYNVAIWRDQPNDDAFTWVDAGKAGKYPGYAKAVNSLIDLVRILDDTAEWFVVAGDDILPDQTKTAEEIAFECSIHFAEQFAGSPSVSLDRAVEAHQAATFGVMQPTGDRWQEGLGGFKNAPIDRVAGSAWVGREFARRVNRGRGPLWPEYTHCFVDEELQEVATRLGVFWQRRDLTHLHQHWARGKGLHDLVDSSNMPAFLAEANSGEHWRKYKNLFETRRNAGFPGSEPL